MRTEVYREIYFSSAHHLRNYCGKCENIHGHNWKVRLYVTRNELTATGFVMDFKDIDRILKKITDVLDHKDLNSMDEFKVLNPTAENIAKYIFVQCDAEIKLQDSLSSVSKVMVWESEKSCAIVEA
ncbi:MAG TPA: 6-carboxytetrahydropterin synthase QueD [bacterium]|nr:6-carboxytetrahydropterin synthase QueD [bacterium]HPS29112.1 6-carboxytetrahydropterin synthase QueD [bacterium]